ncbi:MAG: ATP-binding protein [Clostridia bacterium]|nr:ATP-binding protein [Clostridia bacterium]
MSVNTEKENVQKVPKRILSSLLSSVAAGVVPRAGAPYIAIGRKDEIGAFLSDLEMVNEGGGALRFLVGQYGSGKSFLMQLIRGYALERDFITADADLSPERRLYGSSGSGVATYRELVRNLATKTSPDGGALSGLLARWFSDLMGRLYEQGLTNESPEFDARMNEMVSRDVRQMESMVGGFDFSKILLTYYRAFRAGEEERVSACMRWLRGEYANKTEASQSVGFRVSSVICDDNWYEYIKLWAAFARTIGYRGLVVFIDECVNLYKIPNRVSRENNYEKILSMFNDTLQGRAAGLAIVLGGTPQFLEDSRRGLYSYEALRSRLCDSRFSNADYINLIGPVIRLRRLSDDELFALVKRITALHGQMYNWEVRMTEKEMMDFLQICLSRAGANVLITPREMLRDYMTILNLLYQNPGLHFADLASSVTLKPDAQAEEEEPQEKAPAPEAPEKTGRASFDPNEIQF